MDAFAVSITLGLTVKKPKLIEILIPGFYFGFFQALMPFIGFFAGTFFTKYVESLEHWVAFVLLVLIGLKILIEHFL
jgi:putative Mn2+ efflux pump MntP